MKSLQNPKNRNIISFHTMSAIQQTNRDKLMENKTMNIQDVIDFVYTHTDEDFVLTDLEVLEDLKKDLKNGTKPIYDLDDVKGVKDDIIQTMELNSEQKKVLNDFMKKVEGLYKIEEKLSYNDIIDRVFYTGNDNWHLKKFYDLRKEYNGKDVKNVKLIATDISDEGYCDILFAVEATKDGTKKKELVGANGKMIDNPTNEYQVTIRINDFWDLIEEFGLENKGDFTKADVVALVQLSQDIKIDSTDPSWWYQGLCFWCSQDDGAINPCTIAPKFWDKFRPNVKVSKIIEAVLRQFGFFTQQIAMSIKRALKEEGYLM